MIPSPAPQNGVDPDLTPQLAVSIDKRRLPRYLLDDDWWWEQKVDGHHKLVWLTVDGVSVLNREGAPSDIPRRCVTALPKVTSGAFALDCELLDDRLWVFDLPFAAGIIGPHTPYSSRRDVLDRLAPRFESDSVRILPTARTPAQKMELARKVVGGGGEGLMVKDSRGRYLSGLRNPAVIKAKFVKDVDAVITRFAIGGKQNCGVGVYTADGRLVEIGRVILHPKERRQVQERSVVTVAYLYCVNRDKPRLVQPTRLRPRDDKRPEECTMSQLHVTDRTVHELS